MFFFGSNPLNLIYILISVVISIVLHEVAHGYVALWNGDSTAKRNGRLTFNPLAHFDLFGFLMMALVGYGFAKPVPVNPYNFRNQKRGIFTVAIAGVTVNFGLIIICFPLFYLFEYVAKVSIISTFFLYMIGLNANLIIFNLLPIYPLDGFRVIEAFTYHTNKFCRFMRNFGSYVLIGLIILHLFVNAMINYVNAPLWVEYFDILGMMMTYGTRYLLWPFWALFNLMFGV